MDSSVKQVFERILGVVTTCVTNAETIPGVIATFDEE